MNASEMTFGIEIECTIPAEVISAGRWTIGAHGRGAQCPDLPEGWKVERDSSLSASRPGMVPVEIVSPVLKGAEGLKQIKAVCELLNAWGAKVNSSCGFHVHVGWRPRYVAQLRRLCHLTSHYEPAIFASTGTHGREQNMFCKSVKQDYRGLRWNISTAALLGNQAADRYHVLNLSNLIYGRKSTVEFRAFAGTTNAAKMIAHIRMCLTLCERAWKESKAAKWDPPASRWSPKAGRGENEVRRFVYQNGWVGTWSRNRFGIIEADGLPTMAESAETMIALARKYDARAEGEPS